MKTKTAFMMFFVAALVSFGITVPTATAVGQVDEPDQVVDEEDDANDDPSASTEDENVADASAATSAASGGIIYVGPSASGQAMRILATGYTLQPLNSACLTCFGVGIVVGPSDLFTTSVVDRLRGAYEAGYAIGLTNATVASIQRLRDLLGHQGAAQPADDGARVDLVAFRKSPRPDGRLHFSSQLLLPRAAATAGPLTENDKKRLKRVSKSLRRKLRRKLVKRRQLQQQAIADRNDIEALNKIFSATPVLPDLPPGSNPIQNLINLADSYESKAIQSDPFGNSVQATNSVWSVRSFQNQSDLYYVLQELDAEYGGQNPGRLKGWESFLTSFQRFQGASIIQPSPQTTMSTTTETASVSDTIGGSAGWNETQGLNALVSGSMTITNSKTTTIPPVQISNTTDFPSATAEWTYSLNDLPSNPESNTFFESWIWEVPWSLYGHLNALPYSVNGGLTFGPLDDPQYQLFIPQINVSLPFPFGKVFALQQPAVSSINPSCVDSGDQFTIQGTGFYPSLVQAVIIGGTAVNPANVTTVSDTQIDVIAPDTFECHGTGCTVAVQTTQGTSNTNLTVVISDFCD